MFTFRKLTGLAAVALMLGLSSVASAADTNYVAHLDGTRIEPRAEGRALWMNTSSEIHLSVGIEQCFDHDAVWVVIGDFAQRMPIFDGEGELHVNLFKNDEAFADFPRVSAGTPVAVFSPDGDLVLYGKFRKVGR